MTRNAPRRTHATEMGAQVNSRRKELRLLFDAKDVDMSPLPVKVRLSARMCACERCVCA